MRFFFLPSSPMKNHDAKRKRILLYLFGSSVSIVLLSAAILVIDGLTDKLGTADVALVLGNKVEPDGTPSPRLAARLDRAVELYKTGAFASVIVSGGTGIEGVPEGDAMRDYLVTKNIPATAVIVDNNGVNTHASAENTAAIMHEHGWESVFVITQYFHVPRSELAMKKQGITEVYTAHATFWEWRDVYSTAREIPAYVKYLLR